MPPGDLPLAREVRSRTAEAGLSVAAYGSYYRLGESEAAGMPFASVLESAVALGAPTIRIWAGRKSSTETTPAERAAIVADGLRVAEMVKAQGLTVSLEYHADTLTDTLESVRQLMTELPDPAMEFLWQPSNGEQVEPCLARLHEVLSRVRHLHVFHWWPTANQRRPLAEGADRWRRYLEVVHATGRVTPCLMEFVRESMVPAFLQDATTLREWIAEIDR